LIVYSWEPYRFAVGLPFINNCEERSDFVISVIASGSEAISSFPERKPRDERLLI